MNYLKITNKGLICEEDLMLIGSSTKREQTGKIGMFGSGWKYALAWLLRNGCKPSILAGTDKIEIDFKVRMHRQNAVNVITVNGKETSLTTEMGPKWTGWMAIREILSNAIDEGEHSIDVIWSAPHTGENDKTCIYVPMNGELSEVMMKFDSYFSFNRKENYNIDGTRIFIKQEPSPMNVYRKGIRCYDNYSQTKLDFDFDDLSINEDRLAYNWNIHSEISAVVKNDIPLPLFQAILAEERMDWLPASVNTNILENLKLLIQAGHSFTTLTLRKLGGMLFCKADAIVIPTDWHKKLSDLGLIKGIFDRDGEEEFIRTDTRDISGIEYYLKALNIECKIRTGKCDSHVFFSKNVAYVKDDTLKTDKELAAMIVKSMDTDFIESQMS
jgi:hypothetical protein